MPILNFKTFGSGDPIIIMHGLFGMLDNWQTIAKNLSEEYMVYVIDLRDHGKSEHTTDFNYPLLAQDIAEFLEAEWIHKSYIIGHSMGGKTALQLVKDYPELVEKLIVVDIGIKSYKGGHETILEALTSVPIDSVKTRADADKHLFRYISEPGIRLFLMKNLTRNKEGGYRWKMNLKLLIKHYQEILAGITFDEVVDIPTLFIRGGKSNYIQDEDLDEIFIHFEDMQLITIAAAGHWVHAEQPNELLSAIKSFLAV